MHDRNGDVVLVNQLLYHMLNLDILAVIEFEWRLVEQHMTLLIDLRI